MEKKSIDVDFLDEEQLKLLFQKEEEIKPIKEEQVEIVKQPEPVKEPEKEKEPEPEPEKEKEPEPEKEIEPEKELEPEPEKELEPEKEIEPEKELEVIEEQPVIVEEKPVLEKETPDDALEMSSQKLVVQDDVFEVETIKSAVKVRKKEDKKKERRKQFKSILKDLKVDLGKRSQKLKKEEVKKKKEVEVKRVKKAKTIVTDNSELFKQKKLVAKWKHFPMSRAMTRGYIPKVMQAIEPYWKMPLELDPSLEILVKLKISKSGRILDYEIVESSRNRFFNHSVRQVFKDLNQLPPLPEAFTGESTEIGLKFTSKQNNNE